jgi:hypothetical protein
MSKKIWCLIFGHKDIEVDWVAGDELISSRCYCERCLRTNVERTEVLEKARLAVKHQISVAKLPNS